MRARLLTVLVLLALGLACQSSPPPAARAPARAAERSAAFEAQRAWEHLSALAEIGPRVMGTEGVRRAGDYIVGELAKLGLEVIEQEITARRGEQAPEPIALRNLAAKIPGSSGDLFLLVAPYDTRRYESFRFLGVNDGGSGAAILLEIARVLAGDPLPYTTWLIFLDGEAPLAPDSVSVASPSHFGSRALARYLSEEGVIAGVRLALVLNRVCDADLHVARDLLSHRIYREEFWRAAARLGRTDAFPPGGSFESPVASHRPLVAVGLSRVVALVDASFGGDVPPGLYAGTEDDDLEHCSADSLEAVGKVALEALDKISQRLAKIDRFAKSPLEGPGELTFELPAAPPEADVPVPPSAGEGEGEPAQAPSEGPSASPEAPVAEDAATPQTGDDAVPSSVGEGEGEPAQAPPEGPSASPEAPVAEDAASPQTGDDAVPPSAGEGEGEPTQAPPEGPSASPEAPETP